LATEPYREAPALAALRFILEVISWVAIYFAWGWVPLALVVAALSLFCVPGDKHLVAIKVKGPVRLGIEALAALAGVAAAYLSASIWVAGGLLVAFLVVYAASRTRLEWLSRH
jgi:hypothetical protein